MAKGDSFLPKGKRVMTEQERKLKKFDIQNRVEHIVEDLCWIRDIFDKVIFVVDEEYLDISEERARADKYFKEQKKRWG